MEYAFPRFPLLVHFLALRDTQASKPETVQVDTYHLEATSLYHGRYVSRNFLLVDDAS